MDKKQEKFKIMSITRLKNSDYGNPRYMLVLENIYGKLFLAKTQSNAIIGYEICNSWLNTYKILKYHFSRSNKMIITHNVKGE